MIKRRIIQSYIFILFSTLLNAQTYHFTNYSVKDGLAQSNVSGIIQDSAGFFWLATDGGVSRFDGKNFINYTTENGLADNNVSAIFLAKDNRIWLGHENGSLTVYDGNTFHQINSRLLPKDKKIYGFYQDKTGSLWISTATEGAIKIIDPSRDVKNKLQINTYSGRDGLSQYVFASFEDKQGNFWFLTDIGIKVYGKITKQFEFFRPEEMPLGQVTSLAQDKHLNLLIGTSTGAVSRYYPDTKKFETIINASDVMKITQSGLNLIYAIYEDKKENIWVSIANNGIIRYEKTSGKITPFSTANGLAVNKIKSIYEDAEGNILLGTSGEGLEIFSGERFVSFSKTNGLLDNQVWAVSQDRDGNYWFGTNEGISIFNPKETLPEKAYKKITTENGLPSNFVRALAKDHNQNIWIATWGGKVIKYDVNARRLAPVYSLNESVNNLSSCLLIDSKNNLWIGTLEGIVIYNIDIGSVKTIRTIDGLSDNDITCLFEDSNGNIWIGTKQKGITVFDGKTYNIFNREDGLNYTNISSVAEDAKHNIWIGTEGGGAFVYNGKTFTSYKTKDGLASDFITLITVDKQNNVWLGTNKGLNKYVSAQNEFVSYLKGEGFTGVETKHNAAYNDDEGNVWFGTVNGAFQYNPNKDLPVNVEPLTKLLNFRVNLNEYPVTSKVKLSYKENTLNFDFVSISLSNPEGVKYKLKLEGYDDDWKIAKQNSETYSNLSPGKYVFQLIGCNSAGVCNSQPLSIDIEIAPPYWQTWWFYLIVIASVSGSVFGYIKIRERKLRLEKKILEDRVQERTAEVVRQKHIIEEKQHEILDSINYAKRLQEAILPPKEFLDKHVADSFILYQPKDIVAGDFYWAEVINDKFFVAAADSTGHGVPGAMVSVVCSNALNRTVKEFKETEPGKILDKTRELVLETFEKSASEVKDGMDVSLLCIDTKNKKIYWSGANNPLWYFQNNELKEITADKQPIGKTEKPKPFTTHEIEYSKGTSFYLFTDGFADQFGGPKGKKFKYKQLSELLHSLIGLHAEKQVQHIFKAFEDWKGNLEQVDDVCVIGIKI